MDKKTINNLSIYCKVLAHKVKKMIDHSTVCIKDIYVFSSQEARDIYTLYMVKDFIESFILIEVAMNNSFSCNKLFLVE